MNIIRDIIADYEKLIKTNIQIPLSNGDTIKFAFNPQDLPHLLGLQYLVDNPILFEYKEKRISATDLYNRMCSDGEDAIDIDDFENSEHFDEIYKGRIQYFSSEMILDIIQSRQIVKFDYTKVKNFSTKLDKIEYMFWKKYKDENNNYGYFGIGFMSSGKSSDINYPIDKIINYRMFERKIQFSEEMINSKDIMEKKSALDFIIDALQYLISTKGDTRNEQYKALALSVSDNMDGKVYAVVKKELDELMKLSNEYFDVRHNDYLNAAKEKREPLNDSQFIEYLYNRAYSILYLLRLKS